MTKVFIIGSWIASLATIVAVMWYGIDRARATAPSNVGEVATIACVAILATVILAGAFLTALGLQEDRERVRR